MTRKQLIGFRFALLCEARARLNIEIAQICRELHKLGEKAEAPASLTHLL